MRCGLVERSTLLSAAVAASLASSNSHAEPSSATAAAGRLDMECCGRDGDGEDGGVGGLGNGTEADYGRGGRSSAQGAAASVVTVAAAAAVAAAATVGAIPRIYGDPITEADAVAIRERFDSECGLCVLLRMGHDTRWVGAAGAGWCESDGMYVMTQ